MSPSVCSESILPSSLRPLQRYGTGCCVLDHVSACLPVAPAAVCHPTSSPEMSRRAHSHEPGMFRLARRASLLTRNTLIVLSVRWCMMCRRMGSQQISPFTGPLHHAACKDTGSAPQPSTYHRQRAHQAAVQEMLHDIHGCRYGPPLPAPTQIVSTSQQRTSCECNLAPRPQAEHAADAGHLHHMRFAFCSLAQLQARLPLQLASGQNMH